MKICIPALVLSTLAFPTASASQAPAALGSRIEPAVHEAFAASPDGRVPVVIAIEASAAHGASVAELRASIAEAQELLLADLSSSGFVLASRYRTFAALAGRADARALELLAQHPLVKSVGPSARFATALAESVPHIGADQVQALGFTGAGITVAVLDTGIDTDHPDLADDIAPGAWHSLGDGTNQGPGAEDDHGHGTHVSGIVTSAGNVAPIGVAPDVEILAVKVLDAGGGGTLIDVLAGIDYITASEPNYAALCALNMSLATFISYSQCPCDSVDTLTITIQAALQAAKDAGITNIAASGNGGSCNSMGAPACLSAATAVAATHDTNDVIVDFSNRSGCNALAAPGQDITSSWVGGGTATIGGTSMASPHCAAVAALVCERALSECIVLSPDEVVQILESTGVPTTDPCGTSPNPRRVDALAAFLAVDTEPGSPYCFGDGALIACPCGNESSSGSCEGCANSSGSGAFARTSGSASVGADDLAVQVAQALPGQPALLFAGINAIGGGTGAPFGDGLRCAGMNVLRLGVETPDGSGGASWGPGLASQAGWVAGDERFLQVWYRDPTASPCGSTFNLSNGLAVELEL